MGKLMIVKEPGKKPYPALIETTLPALSQAVGGRLTGKYIFADIELLYAADHQEDGEDNAEIFGQNYKGTLIFASVTHDGFYRDFPGDMDQFRRIFKAIFEGKESQERKPTEET